MSGLEGKSGALTDEEILELALNRLSFIFGLTRSDLSEKLEFGVDLKASFKSDFSQNELDRVWNDIQDVAYREAQKELASDERVVCTVRDYCNHMADCYRQNPGLILDVLRSRA